MNKDFDPAIGTATRWQKGQPSPNPAGRPKQTKLTDALRDVLAEPFPKDKQGRTYAEVIAWRLATEAARGNLRAVSEIADRTEGRAPTQNGLRDAEALPSLDIPDQGSALENLYALTEKLRARIALREAMALPQTPESGS